MQDSTDIRHDYTLPEIGEIFDLPFTRLIAGAQTIHQPLPRGR